MKTILFKIVETYKEKPKKLIAISSLVLVFTILFVGIPETIFYAQSGIMRWLPFFMIFGVIPWAIYRILDEHGMDSLHNLGLACSSVLILGPAFGFWAEFRSLKDLEKNRELTQGVVYEKRLSKGNSEDEWYIRCYFDVDGQEYITSTKKDNFNKYKEGDTLTIEFSKKHPDNNRIVDLNAMRMKN